MAAGISICGIAQEKTTALPKSGTDETIILKKKKNDTEKMTIVIDGDKITLNGKPIEEINDRDIEILKGNADNIQLRKKFMSPLVLNKDALVKANKAFLGVTTEKDDKGAKIAEVAKESAAEKIGLKKDDIITKVGTTKIETPEDLSKAIGTYQPNDEVVISFLRNGKEQKLTPKLQANKNMETKIFKFKNDDYNFEMPELSKELNRNFNENVFNNNRKPKLGLTIQDIEDSNGAKVTAVEENSIAAKAGLLKDDIVTKINAAEIKNVDDLRSALKDIKEGDIISLQYKRNSISNTIEIKFPKKLKTANL
jgi:serine protease Do